MSHTKNWLPNQHGAWAFLITPIVYASLVTSFTYNQILLLIAWLSAFCFNFYFSLALKSRKPTKWRKQLLLYALISILLSIPLLARYPNLLDLAPLLFVGFLINYFFVVNRNERAFLNDLVGVILSAAVGYEAAMFEGNVASTTSIGFALIAAYFIGTIFYVKTMIRQKGEQRWLWYSYLWHSAVAACAFTRTLGLGLFYLILLARAIYFPRTKLKPKHVGIFEFFATVTLLVVLLKS